MGQDSAIEWCDHTFNPWTGCTRVSPGCDNCYAAALAKRSPATFGSWEPGAARKRTSAAYWRQPLAWNRKAEREERRARVFCASMADVFDNQADPAWRCDLWDLIWQTPHLDWLLLTKRPQNIAKMLPVKAAGALADWGTGWPNVWLGTTAENQAEADRRIPRLLTVPAANRFLSCEPLLGPVSLHPMDQPGGWEELRPLYRIGAGDFNGDGEPIPERGRIDWVISGGESGPGARPSHPDWHRSLRDQCAEAGVPFFFKQWGEWLPVIAGDDGGNTVLSPDDGGDELRLADNRRFRISYAFADQTMAQIGKKAAGALLDGREHREVPA